MLPDEITNRLTEVFRAILKNQELVLSDELTARDVPGWDSLNHVNLMISVEEEFGIRFQTKEISGLKNVGELKALLAGKLM